MWIRDITRFDYAAVDRLLLQLQQADAAGRPDLFSPADHYMSREAFDSLLENDNILAFLALERLEPVRRLSRSLTSICWWWMHSTGGAASERPCFRKCRSVPTRSVPTGWS